MNNEMYFSVDIEADGPVPGLNSMLSFGVAAFDLSKTNPLEPVSTFEANLDVLSGPEWPRCHQNADTMAWWAKNPEAWAACRKNPQDPRDVFPRFVEWVKAAAGAKRPVMVVYPTYDFMWIHWYIHVFGNCQKSPFSFSAYDIKSKAADRLGKGFRKAHKGNMPKRWFKGAPKHNHEALTDAIGQGILFVNMELEI